MASYILNAYHVDFEFVYSLEDTEMVTMFNSLEAPSLRKFLCSEGTIHNAELNTFYAAATTEEDKVTVPLSGLVITFDQQMFAEAFELPYEESVDFTQIPKSTSAVIKVRFFASGEALKSSVKKKELKMEFQLLTDIAAKSILSKACSFDAITVKKFGVMVAITDEVLVII